MYNDTWTSLFALTYFGCEIELLCQLKVGKENGDEFRKVTEEVWRNVSQWR